MPEANYLSKELCQETLQNLNSGNSHQIEWNLKMTTQNVQTRNNNNANTKTAQIEKLKE